MTASRDHLAAAVAAITAARIGDIRTVADVAAGRILSAAGLDNMGDDSEDDVDEGVPLDDPARLLITECAAQIGALAAIGARLADGETLADVGLSVASLPDDEL